MPKRDYTDLRRRLADVRGDRLQRMTAVADAIWDEFSSRGVSWVGFYTPAPDRDSMILGPRRDKPACSPLGLHGACGQCFRSGQPLVVRDVAELGADYIACDPRDRSEVILPLFEAGDASHGGAPGCWGVLDIDSHEVGTFTDHDARELGALMVVIGLSTR